MLQMPLCQTVYMAALPAVDRKGTAGCSSDACMRACAGRPCAAAAQVASVLVVRDALGCDLKGGLRLRWGAHAREIQAPAASEQARAAQPSSRRLGASTTLITRCSAFPLRSDRRTVLACAMTWPPTAFCSTQASGAGRQVGPPPEAAPRLGVGHKHGASRGVRHHLLIAQLRPASGTAPTCGGRRLCHGRRWTWACQQRLAGRLQHGMGRAMPGW